MSSDVPLLLTELQGGSRWVHYYLERSLAPVDGEEVDRFSLVGALCTKPNMHVLLEVSQRANCDLRLLIQLGLVGSKLMNQSLHFAVVGLRPEDYARLRYLHLEGVISTFYYRHDAEAYLNG